PFSRMPGFGVFAAAELSRPSSALSLGQAAPFVAIRVFPSRSFRHNGIYVRAGGGTSDPADLAGRLVGVPEYQLTAAVWIRGILAEHYGVAVESVRYRTGGVHQPGRAPKIRPPPPPRAERRPTPPRAPRARVVGEGGP